MGIPTCTGYLEYPFAHMYFQKSRKPWRWHRRNVVFLNDEEGLFPGPNPSCQKHRSMRSVLVHAGRFMCRRKIMRGLLQECVFCHEFGLACRKVSQRSQEKSGVGWFGPVDETVVKRLKAKAYQTRDEGEILMHITIHLHVSTTGTFNQLDWQRDLCRLLVWLLDTFE